MLGETKNQFYLTRAALSKGRRLESNFYQCPARMERLTQTSAKAAELGLPVDGAQDAYGDMARVSHDE